jgi:hypothetical protein
LFIVLFFLFSLLDCPCIGYTFINGSFCSYFFLFIRQAQAQKLIKTSFKNCNASISIYKYATVFINGRSCEESRILWASQQQLKKTKPGSAMQRYPRKQQPFSCWHSRGCVRVPGQAEHTEARPVENSVLGQGKGLTVPPGQ